MRRGATLVPSHPPKDLLRPFAPPVRLHCGNDKFSPVLAMSDFGPDTGKVRAIHRLHVLVAAHDRRFLRVAGFLLSRSGFTVSTSRRRGDLLPAIDAQRPDVVIIDGTASLSEAAANAAVIEALHPGTTVVIVAEDDRIPAVTNLRVHPKWKAFDELVSRIERIHLGLPDAKAEGG